MKEHVLNINDTLTLTTIRQDDAESIARHIHDKEIYQNTLEVPYPYTLKDAQVFIETSRKFEKLNNRQKDWAIRINDEMVGGIGLSYNFGVDSHRTEFGYWIARAYRGKGIMSKVIDRFSEFCLSRYQLKRLEAHVFTHNLASQKILLNNGFKKEGLIRAAFKKDGKYLDAILFSKLSV